MRVYHFVSAKYGLENIRKKRLKIARINELNDPFEFYGINLSDKLLRSAFNRVKSKLSLNKGLLCFSTQWHNPVLWSHYAEKHKGICLGFDIPDIHLGKVSYTRKKLILNGKVPTTPQELDLEAVEKALFTKYSHWKYESEVRCYLTLEEIDPITKLYFAEFNDEINLKSVIVGAESNITRSELDDALGDLVPYVEKIKARLAFQSFRVVKQRNERLWI